MTATFDVNKSYPLVLENEADTIQMIIHALDCFELKASVTRRNRKEDAVFMNWEIDSNSTWFELLSNDMRIGVVADRDDEGFFLLRLLRVIVDERLDLMRSWAEFSES